MHQISDDASLVRLELLGNIARAARLCLVEMEHAESVVFQVEATNDGLSIDCQLFINGQPIGGWGQ